MYRLGLLVICLALAACAQTGATGDTPLEVGSGYERNQVDRSVTLRITPPAGYSRNERKARQYGVYAVFEKDGLPADDAQGFAVAFESANNVPAGTDLTSFIANDVEATRRRIRGVDISSVQVPTAVAARFEGLGFPIEGLLFENPVPRGTRGRVSDSMAFYIQTPGGFWTISRFAPAATLRSDVGTIRAFLQGFEIERR